MLKLFKRKTELERLEIDYQKKLNQAYKMSNINRKASDKLISEANEILEKMKKLE